MSTSQNNYENVIDRLQALSMEPQELFDFLLKSTDEFSAMKKILELNGLPKACTFVLPSLDELNKLKELGLGWLLDMLHFFPLEALALYNTRGPCSMELDPTLGFKIYRMECRNLALHEYEAWKKCDPRNAPKTFEEYVSRTVKGEMKVPLTPHKGKGKPWNNKTKSLIPKNTTEYKDYKQAESDILVKQLSILSYVARLHGMRQMGIRLAGRGGVGSRRLPQLLSALRSLSNVELAMYVIPEVGACHPCWGLANKWWLPPPAADIREYALAFRNALEATGVDVRGTTVEDFEWMITRQLEGIDVSFM